MRSLLKALLTTGGATVVALALGLLTNKILAVSLGAAGIGFYSLMRQTHDTATGLAGLGAGGVVQGLAARQGLARTRLWWAAIALTTLGAILAAAVLWGADRAIARVLFDRDDDVAALAVAVCALTATLGVGYAVLSAGVNAARAIGTLALLSVGGALVTVLLVWPVAQAAQAKPPFLALLIGAPLLLQSIIAFFVLRRLDWLPGNIKEEDARPRRAEFSYFAGFFGFSVVLGAAATFVLLFVRSGIVHADGLAAAGLFAAGWGLGMQSLSLVFSAFGTYIIPSLAAADAEGRRKLLQDAATLVLALSLPLLVGLIAWKPLVLRILYSAEFLPAVSLLQWLLLGTYLKALAWVFAVPFLATADLRRYFLIEAAWYVVFAAGCAVALAGFAPLPGIGMAFCGAYLVYLVMAARLVRQRFEFRLCLRSVASFFAGLALLVPTAALTWDAQTMDWPVAFAAPLVAIFISLSTLSATHRAQGWSLLRARVGL